MDELQWAYVLFAETEGGLQPIAVFSTREKVERYRKAITGAPTTVMQMAVDPPEAGEGA
jgi:hypothetical protein